MEKKDTSKTVAIIILVLLVLGLGGYVVYNKYTVKEDTTELQSQIKSLNQQIETLKNGQTTNTINDGNVNLVGEYKYETTDSTNGMVLKIIIDFMGDGTYYKKESNTIATITYGTYKVDGNTITLNQIFKHDNELASGGKNSKTYTYQLNDDNTITENNQNEKHVLTKTDKVNDVKNELMEWLINDVEEYQKSLSN